jgi:ADP-ribosylglycohydrolase
MEDPMINKFKAVLLGLACGDALGAPTEFSHVASIRKRFGKAGIQDLSQTDGKFTDDTQMSVALAKGLLDAEIHRGQERADAVTLKQPVCTADMNDTHFVMPHVAKRFVEWSISPDNNRAPGGTCMSGCGALKRGAHWLQSGVKNSKGCGSAMRASPVGLVYRDPRVLDEMARASSVVTHGHQAALDAAHAAALGVRLLLDGVEPEEVLAQCFKECVFDENFAMLMSKVLGKVGETMRGETTPEKVQTHEGGLGESWVGDEAVASAFYCFLLAHARGEGFVETVRYGANTDGDSDSIACIAGSFAGALWGLGGDKGVPQEWVDLVEDGAKLTVLAERLYVLHQAVNPQPVDAIEG